MNMSGLCAGLWAVSPSSTATVAILRVTKLTIVPVCVERLVVECSHRASKGDSLIFVDSNVFLYAIDEADPKKQVAARHWRAELWKSRRGRVSFQVLGEFYVNTVRKQITARD